MSKRKCGRCGKDPAEGFASVWSKATGEVFYCHGDEDPVSCYEGAQWAPEALEWAEVALPVLTVTWGDPEPTP